MSLKGKVAKNIAWSWAGRGSEALVGFVVAPFLIHHLGDSTYGVWTLIAALSSYFGLLDLGVCGSVGRYIAFYKAKNDSANANVTLNTALLVMGGLGFLALACMCGVQFAFVEIFRDIPPDQIESARLSLLLIGVNLALSLPCTVFDATLWAHQRFDVMSSVDTANAIIRAGLTFWLIGQGHGIVALAVITLATTLAGGCAKLFATILLDADFRLGPRYLRRAILPSLLGYGFWRLVMSVGRMGAMRLSPFIIGTLLSVAKVTPFAVAMRLLSYTAELFTAACISVTPVATALHAQENSRWQRELMIGGGKFCMVLGLYMAALFVLLGKAFITLWVGPELVIASQLLIIVTLGELLPMSQATTTSIILATARHRVLACLYLIEVVLMGSLGVAFVWLSDGLVGICIAQAFAATLCRGVMQMVYGCRQGRIPITQYVLQAFAPAAAAAGVPFLVLTALVTFHSPQSWMELVLYWLAFTVCYAVGCVFLFGVESVKSQLFGLLGKKPAMDAGRVSSNGVVNGAYNNGPLMATARLSINPLWRRCAAGVRDAATALPSWSRYRLHRPATIVVLGMHRSGTSTITRMVNLCGASLGGPTAGANAWNLAGHWESLEGLAINDLILRFSKGSWDNPPKYLRCGPSIRWKMRKFIGRLHEHGTAAWKDPRTVLTYSLWKPLLTRSVCLATFRHPMSVARSLQRRDGFDLKKGLQLWCVYNERLIAISEQEQNVYWIDFDLGVEHIMEVVKRLSQCTGLEYRAVALDSYAPDLRTSDTAEEPSDARTRNLYAVLRSKVVPAKLI
jgi:O-antigen/teichoic acid export membrane protein